MKKQKQSAPIPDLTAKVYLVPHGYQIDFTNDKGRSVGSSCRDFGGNYEVKKMRNTVIAGMAYVMEDIELRHLRIKKIIKLSEKQMERLLTIRRAIFASIVNEEEWTLKKLPDGWVDSDDINFAVKKKLEGHIKVTDDEITEEIQYLIVRGALKMMGRQVSIG